MPTPPLETSRPFGRTGSVISPLVLGTSGWGPLRPDESVEARDVRINALADAFVAGELPTTSVDTANMYGESQAEGLIGRALTRAGGMPAGRLLQTKLDRDPATGDFSGDRMRASLDESLERLGLQHLQVLYLHDPESIGFEASMSPGGPVEALVRMREEGVVTAIGISAGPVGLLHRFVATDIFDALVSHNRYTLVDRSADALYNEATRRGMGITNAAPYGAGILTGDPRFAGSYGYLPILPAVQRAVDAITARCADIGVPLQAAALQFSLRDPRIHGTIVGVTSLDRMSETAGQAVTPIPEELWDEIDSLVPDPEYALDAPR